MSLRTAATLYAVLAALPSQESREQVAARCLDHAEAFDAARPADVVPEVADLALEVWKAGPHPYETPAAHAARAWATAAAFLVGVQNRDAIKLAEENREKRERELAEKLKR